MNQDILFENGKYYVGNEEFLVGKRYKILSHLGTGGYGAVVKAFDYHLKKEVAIKKISDIFGDPSDTKKVVRELKLLRHFHDSNNLTTVFEILEPQRGFNDIYFSMELFDGDLSRVLRTGIHLNKKTKDTCFYQALKGLDFVHKSGVIHRDIRPKNILIKLEKDFYRVVICDFGLSRQDIIEKSILINISQNSYCSPEGFGGQYDKSSDVWSLAISFLQFFTENQTPIFNEKVREQQLKIIFESVGGPDSVFLDLFNNEISKNIMKQFIDMKITLPLKDLVLSKCIKGVTIDDQQIDLITKMLNPNSHLRITAEDTLSHPLFDNLDVKNDSETTPPKNFVYENSNYSEKHLYKDLCEEILHYYPDTKNI